MKLLAIVSSIDLSRTAGGIPVTWQLLKGFHDAGVQVLVTSINGISFRLLGGEPIPDP